jgi:hypothetical protein
MKLLRLYTGADGQSHFAELDASDAGKLFDITHNTTGILLKKDFAPHILNFHRVPRRRWVITLSGSVDIGLGDGTRVTCVPGDVFLAEDLTGRDIPPRHIVG